MALLLFDIDGTILDTCGSGREAANRTFEKFFNIKKAFNKVPLMGRTDTYIWKYACINNNIPLKEYERIKNVLLREYYKYLKEELRKRRNAYVYPGIKEILDATDSRHCLGLLTGNFKKSAIIKLAHFGLDEYFPVGAFGNDEEDRNRIAQLAIKRAEKYYGKKFKPEEIFIIGDTPFDIECAKNTGTISIAVATGGCKYEDLKKYSPDYLFKSFKNPQEFLKIVDGRK